jgi:hypothetical protein
MTKNTCTLLVVLWLAGASSADAQYTGGAARSSSIGGSAAAAPAPAAGDSTSLFRVRNLSILLLGAGTSGSPTGAGEYTVFDDGLRPNVALEASGRTAHVTSHVTAVFRAVDDQAYAAWGWLGQSLKFDARFDRLRHELGHDPLAYGVEVQGLPPIRKVYKNDEDPNGMYRIARSVGSAAVELTPRTLSYLKAHAAFRAETRNGTAQAVSYNMCQTCHISSRPRSVDQRTLDYSVGATLKKGRSAVDYTFSYRDFRDSAPPPVNVFEGPNTNPDPVLFRTWPAAPGSYAAKRTINDVSLPYGLVPSIGRLAHQVNAVLVLPDNTRLTVDAGYSAQENKSTTAEFTTSTARASLSRRISSRATGAIDYRYTRIENDDILGLWRAAVDSVLSPNDPYAPIAELFSNSSMTRSTQQATARGSFSLDRRQTIKLTADYRRISRDHFDAGTTSAIAAKAEYALRWSKQSLSASYARDWVRNPFENPRAAGEAPPPPEDLNKVYSTFYLTTRNDALTTEPTDRHTVHVKLERKTTPYGTLVLGGRYQLYENSKTDWNTRTFSPEISYVYAKPEGLSLGASYNYYRDQSETLFSAPDMLLKAGQLSYHFGSFARMVPYDENVHVVSTSAAWPASPKLTVTASASWIKGRGNFDTSELLGYTEIPGGKLMDLTDFNQFSGHDSQRLTANGGLEYRVGRSSYLTLHAAYADVSDRLVYLEDTSGHGFTVAVGWTLQRF